MKSIRINLQFLLAVLLMFALSACSDDPPAQGSLAYAQQEVQKVYPKAQVHEIDGLEVKLIYKDKRFSPENVLRAGVDESEIRKDTIMILYGEPGGELQTVEKESVLPIEELLYGPYSGTQTLWLTLSELPAETREAETRSVDGVDMQVAHFEDGSLYATARPGKVTYTLQANQSSGYEEDELLGILAQVSRIQGN
ncbi:hypothetical protein [Saccharibacillus kuerlensis]|uniref:Lipoprotein n=1 Tax=Saccharibacillus kuerlensis TaxID=459527 RepID=A0ABQ2KZ79_9BACL|nr:hypothetical protein [Saccharibacillus kuerlensis]GGN97244.1 hypothetical protein GCM10010969_14990 [Saccharibacillus kuerlensis]